MLADTPPRFNSSKNHSKLVETGCVIISMLIGAKSITTVYGVWGMNKKTQNFCNFVFQKLVIFFKANTAS